MKKSKVLLCTPNLKGMSDGVNRIQPSLGVMLIAQVLVDNGHTVKIHDTALEGWSNKKIIDPVKKVISMGQSDEEIKKVINDFSPDVVAISVLFSNLLESANNIANLVKQVNKNTIVVLGGNHISGSLTDYKFSLTDKNSNLPNHIPELENENIDLAMTGEGEYSMLELVNALSNGDDLGKIPGLVKKIGERKYLINPPKRIHDLNILPRPARHLTNMEGYFDIGAFHSAKSRSNRVLSVMCSRGCPEKCTFCSTPEMWGQSARWRSISHIMDEINNDVKDYKIGELQFEDDSITVNKKNLFALCKELEKVGLPWCTPNGTKVNYHLRDQLSMYKAMADSGCYQISLACESGVQRVLDNVINKRLPIETILPSIENAKKAGMLVHTFWVLGYPGETYEEMQATINFALNSGADSFSISMLCPLPGTPIYREVMKKNLWWEGKSFNDILFRFSLIKVDGFSNSEEFENFINAANIKANMALKKRDPKRFEYKYGDKNHPLVHQT